MTYVSQSRDCPAFAGKVCAESNERPRPGPIRRFLRWLLDDRPLEDGCSVCGRTASEIRDGFCAHRDCPRQWI